jgi:undecaprenyl-diphosphatase
MNQSRSLDEITGGRRYLGTVRPEQDVASRVRGASKGVAFFGRLDEGEIDLVRKAVHSSRHPALRALSVGVSRLGDGWLYPAVAALALAIEGRQGVRFLAAGSTAVVICFALYTQIKGRLARRRPCAYDTRLESGQRPLDVYSFPSGHCMTGAAVGVSLGLACPSTSVGVIVAWLLLAWSRMALGHHYLTDIVCGGVIGGGVSLLVCSMIL